MALVNENQFRNTVNVQEIQNIIRETFTLKKEILLWQNLTHLSTRKKCTAIIEDIDLENLIITLISSDNNFTFVPHLTVYIKGDHKNVLFKGILKKQKNNKISIIIPNEIKVHEFRQRRRFYFPFEDKIKVKISLKNGEKGSSAILTDISSKGCSLIVEGLVESTLKVGEEILINHIPELNIPPDIHSYVRNITPYQVDPFIKSGHLRRVGIEFKDEIPIKEFEIKRVDNKEEETEGRYHLDNSIIPLTDTELFHKLDVIYKKTFKDLKKNVRIKQILQKIKKEEIDDSFFLTRSKLVTIITSNLAKELNWGTEINMRKIAFVSYIHDLTLFAYPHLAKLHYKNDLKWVNLTPEEVEMFYRHPIDVYNLIKDDPSTPPNASEMILQHHELITKKGFPYGIPASRMHPMTFLFVTALDFVHYIFYCIEKKEKWSSAEYIRMKKDQEEFKSPYFYKIFYALSKIY